MISRSLRSMPAAPARAPTVARVGEVSETDTASFEVVRSRLFGIAYRVLGNASEAEDVVQDAWIRWQGTERGNIRDPAAFLATMTARLAMTVGQSARARRETHVGGWLVEEVDAAGARRETHVGPWLVEDVDAAADPSLDAERGEALESAICTLLQKLSPVERAAYLLREAFDYPHRRIAELLALSDANTRQLVTRARRRLSGEHRRPVGVAQQQRLLDAFVAAAQDGDLATLEQVLAADVVAYSGGVEPVRATRLSGRGDSDFRVAA